VVWYLLWGWAENGNRIHSGDPKKAEEKNTMEVFLKGKK